MVWPGDLSKIVVLYFTNRHKHLFALLVLPIAAGSKFIFFTTYLVFQYFSVICPGLIKPLYWMQNVICFRYQSLYLLLYDGIKNESSRFVISVVREVDLCTGDPCPSLWWRNFYLCYLCSDLQLHFLNDWRYCSLHKFSTKKKIPIIVYFVA